MQTRRSPSARWQSTAATEESTPPLKPQITRSLGATVALTLATASSMNEPGVQFGCEPGNLEQERAQNLDAARRVRDLGVKLDAVEAAGGIGDRRERGVAAGRDHAKAGRDLGQPVAVAHPDVELFRDGEGSEDADVFADLDPRGAVLALAARLDFAAELMGHQLFAVTDAEHRNAEAENGGVALGRCRVVDALRAAAQDDGARVERADRGQRQRARMDLAVDVAFAHAPRDELCVLRAVVEDENTVAGSHSRRPS